MKQISSGPKYVYCIQLQSNVPLQKLLKGTLKLYEVDVEYCSNLSKTKKNVFITVITVI